MPSPTAAAAAVIGLVMLPGRAGAVWRSLECHDTARTVEPLPVEGFEEPGSCTMWRTGAWDDSVAVPTFLLGDATFHLHESDRPRECTPERPSFLPGEFIHGHWVSPCSRWYSPKEARRTLEQGGPLSLFGDSLTRQVFNRLVGLLRGNARTLDHHYHSSAEYAANATHDALESGRVFMGAPGTPDHAPVANPTIRVRYYWAPVFSEMPQHPREALGTDGAALTYIHAGLHGVGARVDEIAAAVANATSGSNGATRVVLGTLPSFQGVDHHPWMKERNKYITEEQPLPYVPLNEMALTRVFGRNTEDSVHFQCGVEAKGEQVTGKYLKARAESSRRVPGGWGGGTSVQLPVGTLGAADRGCRSFLHVVVTLPQPCRAAALAAATRLSLALLATPPP